MITYSATPSDLTPKEGHANLTWDVYGKMAGKTQLTPEQKTRFDGLATASLPKEIGAAFSSSDDAPEYRQERLQGRQLGPKYTGDGAASEMEES